MANRKPTRTPSRVRILSNPIEDAMAIDPQQPIPLYFQLKTLLLEEILSGHYSVPTIGCRRSMSCASATSSAELR